jgi:hypothetical protein
MKNNNQSVAVNFHGANAENEFEFLVRSESTLSNLLSDAFGLGKLELAYMLSMAVLVAKEGQMGVKSPHMRKPARRAA